MGDAGILDGALLGPVGPLALAADELAVFVLNVGDGDAIVIRFPDDGNGPSFAVVDAFDGDKVIALLRDLGAQRLRFVCATHPHMDHIAGLRKVLKAFDGAVGEFWDSGFRFTSKTFHGLIEEVERQRITFRRPTSGYEEYINGVRVTVLSPSIALRNRYDTYGVDVNNASIVIKLVYPEVPPSADYPKTEADAAARKAQQGPRPRVVILGGDAQTDAWSKVVEEFPHFDGDDSNWARAIGAKSGQQPLACDFFKVSHHGSKRGINFELVERLGDRSGAGPSFGPDMMAVSSATGGDSGYGFPHDVTLNLLREVRQPLATKAGDPRSPDASLGIHHTAHRLADGSAGGSVIFVASRARARRLYRGLEPVDASLDLAAVRRVSAIS